uniref:Uncharacterized protein n=1 Tax=Rousettus aegyptiacus TaxID=9407 RepID=A0A7J8JHU2_ROUAE|nr:hypothetical protein HJG63_010213 [Rousettus aegyptiacus]
MQQAAVTPHSIFGIHWTLVILSNPWWTPGLSQLKVCTLPQSREHCHPPAAQLQLKYDLQRARVPLPLPQTRKYLAAKPEGGDRRYHYLQDIFLTSVPPQLPKGSETCGEAVVLQKPGILGPSCPSAINYNPISTVVVTTGHKFRLIRAEGDRKDHLVQSAHFIDEKTET